MQVLQATPSGALAVDSRTQTVGTTTETVVAFGTGANYPVGGSSVTPAPVVYCLGTLYFTPGTAATSLTVRFYTNNVLQDNFTIPVVAGSVVAIPLTLQDVSGALAAGGGAMLKLTVQQAAATGNGSCQSRVIVASVP